MKKFFIITALLLLTNIVKSEHQKAAHCTYLYDGIYCFYTSSLNQAFVLESLRSDNCSLDFFNTFLDKSYNYEIEEVKEALSDFVLLHKLNKHSCSVESFLSDFKTHLEKRVAFGSIAYDKRVMLWLFSTVYLAIVYSNTEKISNILEFLKINQELYPNLHFVGNDIDGYKLEYSCQHSYLEDFSIPQGRANFNAQCVLFSIHYFFGQTCDIAKCLGTISSSMLSLELLKKFYYKARYQLRDEELLSFLKELQINKESL